MKSRVPRHNILRERADAQGARTIATLLRYDENNVQGHFHFLFFLPLPVRAKIRVELSFLGRE